MEDPTSIHILPDDALLIIFAFALQHHSWFHALKTPWTVSAVCTRWRALAISSPSLWTQVRFHPDAHPLDVAGTPAHVERDLDALELQLRRAKNCALDISIDLIPGDQLYSDTGDFTTSKDLELFHTVMRNVHRAKTLELVGKVSPEWTLPAEWDRASTFSALRRLEIRGSESNWMDYVSFRNAPLLTDLSLEHLMLKPSLPLPWNNVRQLTLYRTVSTLHDLLEVLHLAAPQVQVIVLRHLKQRVRSGGTQLEPATPLPTPEFLALRKLSILEPVREKWTHDIVAQLHPRQLEWLHLQAYWGLDLMRFAAFPLDVTANLTTLIVEGRITPGSMGGIAAVLVGLKALKTLRFVGENMGDINFLLSALRWSSPNDLEYSSPRQDSISHGRSGGGVCPNLTVLELRRWVLNMRLLEETVRSRLPHDGLVKSDSDSDTEAAPSPCRLREIHLDRVWMWRDEKENVKWLKDLVGRGVLKGSAGASGGTSSEDVPGTLKLVSF